MKYVLLDITVSIGHMIEVLNSVVQASQACFTDIKGELMKKPTWDDDDNELQL